MATLKVAFLTHYTSLYGANRSLLNLIDGLSEYGISSYVISPSEGEITEALRVRGIPVEILPIEWWVSQRPISTRNVLKYVYRHIRWKYQALTRLWINLCVLKSLVDKFRIHQIDIVYTNSYVIPIGVLAAKRLKIPHIWHLREFGDLDYKLYPDFGRGIQKRVLHLSDKFIAISEAIRKHLVQNFEKEQVHVIYNGVASETEFDRLYSINQERLRSQQPYTFAIVGLIHSCKGQEIAIKALSLVVKNFPTTRLLIVGSGNTDHLRQLAQNLGLKNNIEFWGYISDPYKAYLTADAVIMSSKNEGMGRVTVEAMSACRPVIGYDNAGTSELIENEHTGLLYKGEYEELAICMLRLIENPEWGCQMGNAAWQIARQKFSTEAYAKAVYDVLWSITKK